MQQDGNQGGGNVSIGEEDQRRDQEMIRELQDEDGQQDDLLGPARPSRTAGARPSPDEPQRAERKEGDEWHPGDAEQPDRSTSEGLTGSGPSQPEP
jgi:hypothetical protein